MEDSFFSGEAENSGEYLVSHALLISLTCHCRLLGSQKEILSSAVTTTMQPGDTLWQIVPQEWSNHTFQLDYRSFFTVQDASQEWTNQTGMSRSIHPCFGIIILHSIPRQAREPSDALMTSYGRNWTSLTSNKSATNRPDASKEGKRKHGQYNNKYVWENEWGNEKEIRFNGQFDRSA